MHFLKLVQAKRKTVDGWGLYWEVDNRLACAIEQFKKCWSRGMTSQSRDDVIIAGYGNLCAFNINLIMLYNSQEAKNLHEYTSRYRGHFLYFLCFSALFVVFSTFCGF